MKKEEPGVTTPFEPVVCKRDRLFIRQNDYYKKYLYSDILWIEASGGYSYIYLRDRPKIIVTHKLGIVERKLPGEYFVRVHRGFILNLNYIDTLSGNSLKIGDRLFPIGDCYRKKVWSLFDLL